MNKKNEKKKKKKKNETSEEFYKRAAEMFELADHSESNFSKSGAPGFWNPRFLEFLVLGVFFPAMAKEHKKN